MRHPELALVARDLTKNYAMQSFGLLRDIFDIKAKQLYAKN